MRELESLARPARIRSRRDPLTTGRRRSSLTSIWRHPMRYGIRCTLILIALIALLGGTLRLTLAQDATPAPAAQPPEPPSQPATGPGGQEFVYDGMRGQHYGPEPDGTTEPTGYWLFEPTGPRAGTPVPEGPLP